MEDGGHEHTRLRQEDLRQGSAPVVATVAVTRSHGITVFAVKSFSLRLRLRKKDFRASIDQRLGHQYQICVLWQEITTTSVVLFVFVSEETMTSPCL